MPAFGAYSAAALRVSCFTHPAQVVKTIATTVPIARYCIVVTRPRCEHHLPAYEDPSLTTMEGQTPGGSFKKVGGAITATTPKSVDRLVAPENCAAVLPGLHRRSDISLRVGLEHVMMTLVGIVEHLATGIGHRHRFLGLTHLIGELDATFAFPLGYRASTLFRWCSDHIAACAQRDHQPQSHPCSNQSLHACFSSRRGLARRGAGDAPRRTQLASSS